MKTRKFWIGICVVFLVLFSSVAASAASLIPGDCLDSVTVDGSTICFMGQDNNGDGTTTWTYGVRKGSRRYLIECGTGWCLKPYHVLIMC